MIRTAINLDESDKAWLYQQASSRHVPMAELVRQAIRAYRASQPCGEENFEALLTGTTGTLQQGDGLEWQEHLRNEWAR